MGKSTLVFTLCSVLLCGFPLVITAQAPSPPPSGSSPDAPDPALTPGPPGPFELEATKVPKASDASTLAPPSSPALSPGPPEGLGSFELEGSRVPEAPSLSAQTPPASPSSTLLRAPQIIETPLDEPERLPDPVARRPFELEATKVPGPPRLAIDLAQAQRFGIIILVLSLFGNAWQFYRQRLSAKTVCNELMTTFNSVAWLLARCANKTRELGERLGAESAADPALLKEFREFSLDTEFMLRTFHEQLVAVAKNFKGNDKRWKAGQFGHTPEELEKIRRPPAGQPAPEW